LTPSRDIRGLSPNTNQKSITCSDGIRTMGETLCECDRETKHVFTFLVSIFIPFHSIGITRLQPKVADRKDKSTGLKSKAKKPIRTPSHVLRSGSSSGRAVLTFSYFLYFRFFFFVQISSEKFDSFEFHEFASEPVPLELYVPLFQRHTESEPRVLRARMPRTYYTLC
jgi:hypothetical protein